MPGKNTIVRSVAPKSLFESAKAVIGSTTTYDQGDLLIFDDATNRIRRPTTEAECSTFCGIAINSLVNGKEVSPYNTDVVGSQSISDQPGPLYGVVARLVLKTGDSINPGDDVFHDPVTGFRGVTSTPGTKSIGLYQGPAIAGAAAGTEIPVLIGCRAKNDSLKF